MKKRKLLLSSTALLPIIGAAQAQRPNIMLIVVDDMGYSDLECFGGEVESPNLNALATSGMRFTQFYNSGRSCPSRAQLLTGRYAQNLRASAAILERKNPERSLVRGGQRHG